jgi:hypothetical protein
MTQLQKNSGHFSPKPPGDHSTLAVPAGRKGSSGSATEAASDALCTTALKKQAVRDTQALLIIPRFSWECRLDHRQDTGLDRLR